MYKYTANGEYINISNRHKVQKKRVYYTKIEQFNDSQFSNTEAPNTDVSTSISEVPNTNVSTLLTNLSTSISEVPNTNLSTSSNDDHNAYLSKLLSQWGVSTQDENVPLIPINSSTYNVSKYDNPDTDL